MKRINYERAMSDLCEPSPESSQERGSRMLREFQEDRPPFTQAEAEALLVELFGTKALYRHGNPFPSFEAAKAADMTRVRS